MKLYDWIHLPSQEEALSFYKSKGGQEPVFLQWANIVSNTAISQSSINAKWEYSNQQSDGNLELIITALFTNKAKNMVYALRSYENTNGEYAYSEIIRSLNVNYDPFDWYAEYYSIENGHNKGYRVLAWRTSKNFWDGSDINDIVWDEWHNVTEKDIIDSVYIEGGLLYQNKTNVCEFRYELIPYEVRYHSAGKIVNTKTQHYGTAIEVPEPINLPAPENLIFGGWYTNTHFTGAPVTTLTMPVGGIDIFAFWKHPDVKVNFDTTGSSEIAPQTIAWGSKVNQPEIPVREGYEFGGWYYISADTSVPAPFVFDLNIEHDMTLVAAWKSTQTPATYTVIHKTKDGKVLATWTAKGIVGETHTEYALGSHGARRRGFKYVNASGITYDLSSNEANNVYEFVYENQPLTSFIVHFLDEATGLPVAQDIKIDSEEALLNFRALELKGYQVLFGGKGYLSNLEGGKELSFWYEKDKVVPPKEDPQGETDSESEIDPQPEPKPEPKPQPAHQTGMPKQAVKVKANTAQLAQPSKQKAATPQTSDGTKTALPAAAGILGAMLLAVQALLGKKVKR